MKKTVKWILLGIVILSSAGGLAYYMSLPLNIETLLIKPQVAELYFIEQGYGATGTATEVYPLVSGEVVSVNIAENSFINKGDVICVIDSREYELLVQQAQSNIRAYEAQRADLKVNENREKTNLTYQKQDLSAQLEALTATRQSKEISKEEQMRLQQNVNHQLDSSLAWAQSNLETAAVLYENGALSKQAYDDALKAVQDAEKNLEQGKMQIDVIEASEDKLTGSDEYFDAMADSIQTQIKSIDAALSGSYINALSSYYSALSEGEAANIAQLEKRVGDCVVRAPVSGYVKSLPVQDTNITVSGVPVAMIVPDHQVYIEVYVLTSDIQSVGIGDSVEVIIRGREGDKVYLSQVLALEEKAVDRISALGVNEKKVKVTVAVPEDSGILEGYDVDVKFTYYHQPDKMIIPKTALFQTNGQDMVWAVKDGAVLAVAVEKGIELRSEVVIETGLDAGSEVIKDANDQRLREGVRIHGGQ